MRIRTIRFTRNLLPIVLLFALGGCASTQKNPATQIIGQWTTTVSGFNILTTYSDDSVSIDGHAPLKYELTGNLLTIDNDETTRRTVSFPSSAEMIQIDIITGTEHRFDRAGS